MNNEYVETFTVGQLKTLIARFNKKEWSLVCSKSSYEKMKPVEKEINDLGVDLVLCEMVDVDSMCYLVPKTPYVVGE